MITRDRLLDILNYDPETGKWIWLVSPANPVRAGSSAGTIGKKGYLVIQIEGKIYKAHRLAFLYMTGAWPSVHVDHRDTIRSNGAWNNLREATRSQNGANKSAQINNSCGYKGVFLRKRKGRSDRWVARITKNQKKKYIGQYDTAEQAHAAYCAAAISLFGEFARP